MKSASETLEGTISLFGFPSIEAHMKVRPRSRSWRWTRAGLFWGLGLLIAPAVGLVPPHAPWVVAALGVGGFMGTRKWKERYTVLSFQGECPRCGGKLTLKSGTPLRPAMTLPCEGCNHDSRLVPTIPGPPTSTGDPI